MAADVLTPWAQFASLIFVAAARNRQFSTTAQKIRGRHQASETRCRPLLRFIYERALPTTAPRQTPGRR